MYTIKITNYNTCFYFIIFHLQVKELKELLQKLEDGHFIVVCGMTGCGKSSLVVEVLNDPLITMQYLQVSYLFDNIICIYCN